MAIRFSRKVKVVSPNRAATELVPTRATLIGKLRNLDDDASWREFFETYYRLIYGRVINRRVPVPDAEDIVAEIVEGISRRMPEFVYDPARCSFKTWLFRIVENRVADYFRRRARALPEADGGAYDRMREELPDPNSAEPDRSWEEAWKANLAQAAFERVRKKANPRYLQIYIYTEIEGHSVSEAVEHLQTSPEDVYMAKHRIREVLRHEGEQLEREERVRELKAETRKTTGNGGR